MSNSLPDSILLNTKFKCNVIVEGVNYEELDAKDPETLTEEEKVAMLGRPRLGDITKIQIRIRESKEFKVIPFPAFLTFQKLKTFDVLTC